MILLGAAVALALLVVLVLVQWVVLVALGQVIQSLVLLLLTAAVEVQGRFL
jgi:hypothetical protein